MFFLYLSIVGNNFFAENSSKTARVPAQNLCRVLNDGCRQDIDCCSFNCNQNRCQRRVLTMGAIGEDCRINTDCVTEFCEPRIQKCAPSSEHRAHVGQFCLFNSDCFSGFCDPAYRICRGTEIQKAYVGQYCEQNSECLSNNCEQNYRICLGGGDDLARYNEFCTFNTQCLSNFCNRNYFRCQ